MKSIIIKKLTILTIVSIVSIASTSQASTFTPTNILNNKADIQTFLAASSDTKQTDDNLLLSAFMKNYLLAYSEDPEKVGDRCSPYPLCKFNHNYSQKIKNI